MHIAVNTNYGCRITLYILFAVLVYWVAAWPGFKIYPSSSNRGNQLEPMSHLRSNNGLPAQPPVTFL